MTTNLDLDYGKKLVELRKITADLQQVLNACVASNERAFGLQGIEADKVENNRKWAVFRAAAADYAPQILAVMPDLIEQAGRVEELERKVKLFDEACANMSGAVDEILRLFDSDGNLLGSGKWRLDCIFKYAKEADAEFKKAVAALTPKETT